MASFGGDFVDLTASISVSLGPRDGIHLSEVAMALSYDSRVKATDALALDTSSQSALLTGSVGSGHRSADLIFSAFAAG